MTTAGASN